MALWYNGYDFLAPLSIGAQKPRSEPIRYGDLGSPHGFIKSSWVFAVSNLKLTYVRTVKASHIELRWKAKLWHFAKPAAGSWARKRH